MSRSNLTSPAYPSAALKCSARDRRIGLIPERLAAPDCEQFAVSDPARPSLPNPGSRILSACRRRFAGDWMGHFSRPLLLETFVDADFHDGIIYRADNWTLAGKPRSCRWIHGGCSPTPSESVKPVFVKPLHRVRGSCPMRTNIE